MKEKEKIQRGMSSVTEIEFFTEEKPDCFVGSTLSEVILEVIWSKTNGVRLSEEHPAPQKAKQNWLHLRYTEKNEIRVLNTSVEWKAKTKAI